MQGDNCYITPEEYALAEKNGICKGTLESRIRAYGWDKDKAINTPVRKRHDIPKKFKDLAKENGISINTFYQRVCIKKWSFEKAATEPIQDKETRALIFSNRNRKYPKKYIEKAKANGISDYNFRRRIREYGWNYEKAATTPVMSKKEIGLIVKETFRMF